MFGISSPETTKEIKGRFFREAQSSRGGEFQFYLASKNIVFSSHYGWFLLSWNLIIKYLNDHELQGSPAIH